MTCGSASWLWPSGSPSQQVASHGFTLILTALGIEPGASCLRGELSAADPTLRDHSGSSEINTVILCTVSYCPS